MSSQAIFDMAAKALLSAEARERAVLPLIYLGAPILETPCDEIDMFDDPTNTYQPLTHLATQMEITRQHWQGLGLAAPQVGRSARLAIIACEGVRAVICNPTISDPSGEQIHMEGCLSIPTYEMKRKRPLQLTVRFQDVLGVWHSLTATGLLARTIQHEVDHLNGKLFIDGFSRNIRRAAQRAVDKHRRMANV